MKTENCKNYFSQENLRLFGKAYEDFRRVQAIQETRFAVRALGLRKGERVLDLFCGMGENAVSLASKGLKVTAVDFSDYSIQRARALAEARRVSVDFRCEDVRGIVWKSAFDAALVLFNSFGYCETDEENQEILNRIAASLKRKGRWLIDFVSRDAAANLSRQDSQQVATGEVSQEVSFRFNPVEGRLSIRRAVSAPKRKVLRISQRAYTFSELGPMMERAGLKIRAGYGDYKGRKLRLDSPRLIVTGYKL